MRGNFVEDEITYSPYTLPFGRTWAKWVVEWCKWLFSIPKTNNPALDGTGKNCSVDQKEPNVWFLAGTFGNQILVKRTCGIPKNKAILFPTMLKECSFVEDEDLHTESELINRSKSDIDLVTAMEVSLDGTILEKAAAYRVQSDIYDLVFPENNVYDVKPGLTRSTCNGYWVFLKPLSVGKHKLYFRAEAALPEGYIVAEQLKKIDVYKPIHEYIISHASFKIDVSYDLIVE